MSLCDDAYLIIIRSIRPGDMAAEIRTNKLTLTVLVVLGMMVTLFVVLNTGKEYSGDNQTIHISQLISASIDLVERGGRRIVQVRNMDDSQIGQLSKGLTKEGKNEYVTMGDKVGHNLLIDCSCFDFVPHQGVTPNHSFRIEISMA